MNDVIFYPAFTREVVTKFEKASVKRDLPLSVRRQIEEMYFIDEVVHQLFCHFVKGKKVDFANKQVFGKITISAKRDNTKGIDSRLEEGKTYYGWMVSGKQDGYREVKFLLILNNLTQAMALFKEKALCSQKKINQ